jgi:type I restriction enzyme M protein
MLQGLMYFVHEIESIPAFADVILNTYFSILGRHGGETITDRSLAEIIKRFSGDVSKARVFDGAAGLCSVVSQLDAGLLLLQEISRSARNVGQGLLTLKGKQFEYALGDSLISPRPSAKADMVVMQPPWRMRLQADNLNKLMGSKFIAFAKGNKLPTSASDALWVQFALFNANEAGKVILVMPHGWTFRGGYDAKLRKYLLDNDLVESITALPAGIHRHTSIPSLILVLNKNKTKKQQGVVNLIDASQLGRRERKNLRVPEAELDLIVTLMRGEPEENGLLKKVLLPVIYQNDYNLNIKEYFTEIRHLEIPDYKTEKSKLAELQKSAKEAQAKLLMMLP